jgi:hypothetical protein
MPLPTRDPLRELVASLARSAALLGGITAKLEGVEAPRRPSMAEEARAVIVEVTKAARPVAPRPELN